MSLEAMVAAAKDGKIAEFEGAFNATISQRVASRIDDMKVELGQPKQSGEHRTED